MICNSYKTEQELEPIDLNKWVDENWYVIGYDDMLEWYDDVTKEVFAHEEA